MLVVYDEDTVNVLIAFYSPSFQLHCLIDFLQRLDLRVFISNSMAFASLQEHVDREVESRGEVLTNLLLKTSHKNLPDCHKSSRRSHDKFQELHVVQYGAVLYGVVLHELVNEVLYDVVLYGEVLYGEVLYDEVLYGEVKDDERVL